MEEYLHDPIAWREAGGGRGQNFPFSRMEWAFSGWFWPMAKSASWPLPLQEARLMAAIQHCKTCAWFEGALSPTDETHFGPPLWVPAFAQPPLHWTRWQERELVRRLCGLVDLERDEEALCILRKWLFLRSIGPLGVGVHPIDYPEESAWGNEAHHLRFYEEEYGEVELTQAIVDAAVERIDRDHWTHTHFGEYGKTREYIPDLLYFQCSKVRLLLHYREKEQADEPL